MCFPSFPTTNSRKILLVDSAWHWSVGNIEVRVFGAIKQCFAEESDTAFEEESEEDSYDPEEDSFDYGVDA